MDFKCSVFGKHKSYDWYWNRTLDLYQLTTYPVKFELHSKKHSNLILPIVQFLVFICRTEGLRNLQCNKIDFSVIFN